VGERVFPIAQRWVQSVLVSDEDIVAAQRVLWAELRVAAEPGGACALAAVLSRRLPVQAGRRVGVVVSGGNASAIDFGK
jgi:threonine dehydratase